MELLSKTTRSPSPPAAADPVEKRSCPRFPFSPAVEALDLKSDMRIMGRLSDISRNGCYVDTINPFAKDAAATLTVTRDNQSFKTQAKVVYSKPGMGMGLLFTTAEPDQLRILGSWLNELSGGRIDKEEQPNVFLQRETAKTTDVELRELRKVVSELVALLNGKNILNDSEGMALLRKLAK
ncbi:MAG: PilZ domain-containing protein [Candidatus Acidiferrum sp.]